MKRFYIKQIAASGSGVKYSAIDFDKGVNIIHGPSNTGKSYVLNCINFMFGSDSKAIPFTKSETGYDTIVMRMENDDGDFAEFERKIKDGKNGETGAGKVKVTTSLEGYADGDYSIKDKEYSDFLLRLFGITKRHKVITQQNLDTRDLTVRMIFHFLFLDESHIFEKETPLYAAGYSKPTEHIMSLLFLLEGNDYSEMVPEETSEERQKAAVQKTGVILYLNQKIQELTQRRGEIEQAVAEIGDVDVEAEMDSIVAEIESIDQQIVSATEESRALLEQVYSISSQLEEARFLRDRYKVLKSQYNSDIRRLRFITDGEKKSGNIHRLVKCPFCDNEMREQQQPRTSYIEASGAELERVTALLADLREAEKDINEEIASLENQINALNSRNDEVTKLIGKRLKPRAAELRSMMASYKRVLQMRQEIYAIDTMAAELNTDAFDRETDGEETELKFNAKDKINTDMWKALSDRFAEAVIQCGFPGKPDARISIDTMDAVVNGKFKKDEGKGYRAFLNTIMLFNLMKYLEESGTYAPRLLFLDSPILSLKEKKYDIAENEKAPSGMRESLFRYMIEHCGENQVIIAENELPENVDYSGTNLIEFTMDKEAGRYGFLLSKQDTAKE